MIYLNIQEFFIFLIKTVHLSIQFLTEKLKLYVTLKNFFSWKRRLQSIALQGFNDSQLSEATIKTDEDWDANRIDILWFHLSMKKITGTSKSKFENLFKSIKAAFSVVHSNAEEESLFSKVSFVKHLALPIEQTTWSTMLYI